MYYGYALEHASLQTTMNFYTHVLYKHKQGEMELQFYLLKSKIGSCWNIWNGV